MKSGDLVIIRSSLYSPETGILRIADSGKTGIDRLSKRENL